MRLDDQIEALATRQHSLVAVWQLHGLGATRTEIDRTRNSKRWSTITPRVLALRGGSDTPDREVMAAVLDASPGAVASHSTAAAMWGVPGCRVQPVHTTRHRGVARRRSPLCSVHEVIDLLPAHVRLIRGIPVTSPGRTVFDLAAVFHPARVERALDWFWNERLLDGRVIDGLVSELAARGRTGSTLMRQLAAARGTGYVPPASTLERRFEEVLAKHGLPHMRRQVDVGGSSWTGRVDFRDDVLPLIVEVQSEKHHSALTDRAADDARLAALRRDGFVVVEVWDTEVWHETPKVADRIRRARRALERQQRRAS